MLRVAETAEETKDHRVVNDKQQRQWQQRSIKTSRAYLKRLVEYIHVHAGYS